MIDCWDGQAWQRILQTADGPMELTVTQEQKEGLRLLASVDRPGIEPSSAMLAEAKRTVIRMLGLDIRIDGFYALAKRDQRLSLLARKFIGMRPPRFPSTFEALVNAVACQQLSLTVGIHLLNRLALHFGVTSPMSGVPAFPSAQQLADADPAALRTLGFSGAKAKTLVSLGQKVTSNEIDLEALDHSDDHVARDTLIGLPGIGRWSADYTLLRGLGRLEILPGDDVGARNNLRRHFNLASDSGYDAVIALSREWWPYGGLVYFHLLLNRLADEGCLEPCAGI